MDAADFLNSESDEDDSSEPRAPFSDLLKFN